MAHAVVQGPLATLTYRSKASPSFSQNELDGLLQVARSRNKASAVTGLLIYDDGRFFQWLEGPAENVDSIWSLIRQDRRHTEIELLEHTTCEARVFGEWDMKLATHAPEVATTASQPVVINPALVKALPQSTARIAAYVSGSLRQSTSLAPDAQRRTLRAVDRLQPFQPLLPLAHPKAAELAQLLVAIDPADAFAVLALLTAEVGSVANACASISEPAARSLGELWANDDCTEVDVVLGLGRLRTGIRRVDFGPQLATTYGAPLRAVLVVPQPGETHVLGAALDAEVLCRDGFEPQCEFPKSDQHLADLVGQRWFDAIDVSLSTAFRREEWLPRMADTIALARRASLNPEIVVVVGGRIFYEHGANARSVGADGDNGSAFSLPDSIRDSISKKVV